MLSIIATHCCWRIVQLYIIKFQFPRKARVQHSSNLCAAPPCARSTKTNGTVRTDVSTGTSSWLVRLLRVLLALSCDGGMVNIACLHVAAFSHLGMLFDKMAVDSDRFKNAEVFFAT